MTCKRLSICAACILALSACGAIEDMKDALAHCQNVADELNRSYGEKPNVGFTITNGVLAVNVTFPGVPQNAVLAELAEKSKTVIIREFQQTPNKIVLAFTLTAK